MREELLVAAIAPLVLGIVLDAAYPYHRGLLLAIHPVHTSYSMALSLARRFRGMGRTGGIALWVIVVGSHLAIYGAALWAAWRLGILAWTLAAAYVVKVSMPIRLLVDQVRETGRRLEDHDLEGARGVAQGLVRRDLRTADAGHVGSAALESLFESLVDGVTSPLLYYALMGPMGALLQRLSNTMDGAVGFRDPQFSEVGWFSAKVDTVLNYLPARLTALLEIASCGIGGSRRAARAYERHRRSTASLNAGHPMSAAAGCLGVALEKAGEYRLGDGDLPGPGDIARGLRLAMRTLCLAFAIAVPSIAACALGAHLVWLS
ncbi:MAG: cobalamin biosynthesis protein [Conexivisphaera sp.]